MERSIMKLICVILIAMLGFCLASCGSWKTVRYGDLKFEVMRDWKFEDSYLGNVYYFGFVEDAVGEDRYVEFGFEGETRHDSYFNVLEETILTGSGDLSVEEVGKIRAEQFIEMARKLEGTKDIGFAASIAHGKAIINDLPAYEVVSGVVLERNGKWKAEKHIFIEKNEKIYMFSFIGWYMYEEEADRFVSYYLHVRNSIQ